MKLSLIQLISLAISPVLAVLIYYGGGYLYFTYKVWYRKKIIVAILKQLKPNITKEEIDQLFINILKK